MMNCCSGEHPEQHWDGGCIPLAWLGTPPCASHRSASPPAAALTQFPKFAGVNSSKDIDSREAAFGYQSRMLLSQLPFPLDEHHHPFHECLTTSLLPESFGNTQGSAPEQHPGLGMTSVLSEDALIPSWQGCWHLGSGRGHPHSRAGPTGHP